MCPYYIERCPHFRYGYKYFYSFGGVTHVDHMLTECTCVGGGVHVSKV